MKEIVVNTQAQLDALPKAFKEYTRIVIRETGGIRISVEAWENSSVVAWENSSVEAWGNSSVEAWGNVAVRLQSDAASVVLFMFAVCWMLAKGKVTKKSKTATAITPKRKPGVSGWLEQQGIQKKKTVILFKRVSSDFKTQEKTPNETLWAVGSTLVHAKWDPATRECGPGKFHACSHAYFCDEFRSEKSDRYVAIQVHVADMHVWNSPQYPHKVAVRKAVVLYECDRFGKKI